MAVRVCCLSLLLVVNLSSCQEQPNQFEALDANGPAAAEDAVLMSEALPEIGPIGPRAAGLENRWLSRDLSSYSFGADIDKERLKLDIDMIERIRIALPPAAERVYLLQNLHLNTEPELVDLGFDHLRISTQERGGYSHCEFQMIFYFEALQDLEVTCVWRDGVPKGVDTVLRDSLGPGFSIAQEGARIEGRARFVFPRMKARAAERLRNELGEINQVEVPTDLAEAFETLMSPSAQHTVGSECSYAGVRPYANKATRKLINAQRDDLLRNVLHGPNPEARVYAAWGLSKLEAVTESDRNIIDKLRHLNIRLEACYGCMVLYEPSHEVWTNFDQQPP